MKIAHFADSNSFSFAAAKEYGDMVLVAGERVQFVSCASMEKCFDAIENGAADVCVVPLENSVEGAVGETMDLMSSRLAYIVKQLVIPISHCLVGVEGEKIENVQKICSHYQALAQCRDFLQRALPNAFVLPVSSTSEALTQVENGVAAIARLPLKGQASLVQNIQDYKSNATKFVVLKGVPTFVGNNCSLLFETLDEPGALLKVLNEVAQHDINMTKIESRPQKTGMGRYVFFADIEFKGDKESLTAFLASLQTKTTRLKFLGKY